MVRITMTSSAVLKKNVGLCSLIVGRSVKHASNTKQRIVDAMMNKIDGDGTPHAALSIANELDRKR